MMGLSARCRVGSESCQGGASQIVELDSPNYKVTVSRGANAKLSTAVLKGAATLREFANLFGEKF